MIRLTSADYTVQPWKNGKGVTTELWRMMQDDKLLVRLSRAVVAEDGPFSVFPGLQRSLTVISGPGFRLKGAGLDLRCDPLKPVAFSGAIEVLASETNGQTSEDLNLMTADHLPLPQVQVIGKGGLAAGGLLIGYALEPAVVNAMPIDAGDVVLTREAVALSGHGPVLFARLFGL